MGVYLWNYPGGSEHRASIEGHARARVSCSLEWEAVKDTEAPKLSGTPVVGVKMGVSHGTWSNSPVAYEYQWEDCNRKENRVRRFLVRRTPTTRWRLAMSVIN